MGLGVPVLEYRNTKVLEYYLHLLQYCNIGMVQLHGVCEPAVLEYLTLVLLACVRARRNTCMYVHVYIHLRVQYCTNITLSQKQLEIQALSTRVPWYVHVYVPAP